jgi:hypothetical protein
MSVRNHSSKCTPFRLPTRAVLGAALGTLLLAGCAGDSGPAGGLSTSAISDHPTRTDPTCVSLAARIDNLRGDGITQRLSEAAQGKTATVNVKRASLAKAADLDRANAEYQAKCSTGPGPQTASLAAKPAPSPTAAPATKAVAPVAPKAAAPAVPKGAAPGVPAKGASVPAKPGPAVAAAAASAAPAVPPPAGLSVAPIGSPAPPAGQVAARVASEPAPLIPPIPTSGN